MSRGGKRVGGIGFRWGWEGQKRFPDLLRRFSADILRCGTKITHRQRCPLFTIQYVLVSISHGGATLRTKLFPEALRVIR